MVPLWRVRIRCLSLPQDTLSEARFLSALLLRCTEPHRVPADHASEHLPRKRGPESSSPEASAPGNDTSTAPEEGPQHVTQGAADAGGPRDPEEAREEVGGTSGDGEDTSSDREGGPSAGEDFRSMIASMGPNVREIRPGGLTMYVVGSGPSGDPCEEREEGMAGPLKLGSRGVEANELYWVYTACGGDRADEESLAKQTRQDSAETWPETADIALKGAWCGHDRLHSPTSSTQMQRGLSLGACREQGWCMWVE